MSSAPSVTPPTLLHLQWAAPATRSSWGSGRTRAETTPASSSLGLNRRAVAAFWLRLEQWERNYYSIIILWTLFLAWLLTEIVIFDGCWLDSLIIYYCLQPSGEFSSPLHPESYSHNLNCEWVIRLPPEDRWELGTRPPHLTQNLGHNPIVLLQHFNDYNLRFYVATFYNKYFRENCANHFSDQQKLTLLFSKLI